MFSFILYLAGALVAFLAIFAIPFCSVALAVSLGLLGLAVASKGQ